MGKNPQYSLQFDHLPKGTDVTVWILLSRHVTDFKRNIHEHLDCVDACVQDDDDSDYLTCHIYQSTGGRVYMNTYPHVNGLYTNDPHNLIRFDFHSQEELAVYTLVLSQLRRKSDISYTISMFSTSSFGLTHTPSLPSHQLELNGAWMDAGSSSNGFSSSGGSTSNESFYLNPQYRLTVTEPALLHFEIFYPINIKGNISVISNSSMILNPHGDLIPDRTNRILDGEELVTSGPYRTGYCQCAHKFEPGLYNVIFSNYSSDMKGSFKGLCASTSSSISLVAIPAEGIGLEKTTVYGSWTDSTSCGCSNFGNYLGNPIFRIDIPMHFNKNIYLLLRLIPTNIKHIPINISMYEIIGEDADSGRPALSGKSPRTALASSGPYSSWPCGARIEPFFIPQTSNSDHKISLAVIPSTYEPGMLAEFSIFCYSNASDITMYEIPTKCF